MSVHDKDKGYGPNAAGPTSGYLQQILEITGIGLWDWNLQTDEVVYSPEWEIIAGHEPGTLPQTLDSWTQALLPEDLAQAEEQIELHLAGKKEKYEAEFRMRRPDGTIIWAQDKGRVTEWDQDGKPLRIIGVIQEVTRLKQTEEDLRNQTEQLDFVAKLCGLGRWDWDMRTDLISYDSNYRELTGHTEMDGTFEEWASLVHPDDLDRISQALEDYVAGKSPVYSQEVRMLHADGRYVWTQDIGRIVSWDEKGKPTRLLGGHLDIDKRKSAEMALQEALDQLGRRNEALRGEVDKTARSLTEVREFSNAMLDANPYINVIFDDQLHLQDCNPAAVAFFGFENKEALLEGLIPLLQRSIPAFQPDGSPSTPLSARFEYVMAHGFIEFEVELVLNDQRIPVLFTMKKVKHGGSFAIAGYLVDMRSIKEARNELLHQDYLLRQVNRAATSLLSTDTDDFDGVVAKVLKSLARSVGASRISIWQRYEEGDETLAKVIYSWDSARRSKDIGEGPTTFSNLDAGIWHQSLTHNRIINLHANDIPPEIRGKLIGNNARVVMLIPVVLQGEYWGLISLAKTVGDTLFSTIEEKVIQSGGILTVSAILRNQINQNLIIAREEALASGNAKGEFLSRMSHEIRTPMNAIIGMTEIAQKSDDLDRIHYSLDRIRAASGQLLSLINDILDMSKIESGKLEIVNSPFDFEKTMNNVFGVVQVQMDAKRQQFNFCFDNLFERQMVADELRLSQVMINLLTNAVKFTPEDGEIAVRVGWRQTEEGKQILHVEVSDTGIGISPEQRDRLFRSFEQADGSITRRFGGTGLGLAISKRITELMGGDIWVESEEGKGSTFIFEVEFTWGALLSSAARIPLDKSLRLLVVDDNAEAREFFANVLREMDIRFDMAESGWEAVEKVAAARDKGMPYGVVLLDWMMPGMNGTETARLIRQEMGDEIIVVMTSAASWAEIGPEVSPLGVEDFLPKPVLPSALYNTLVKVTGVKGAEVDTATDCNEPECREYRWPGKHVLVVEDVEINREIIQAILEDTEMIIDYAENGLLAVEAFERGATRYDLVLMDIQMPELDGLGATRRIRAMDSENAKTVPIIAMTANAFSEDVERCLAAGMNDHIAKPIDVTAMMDKLATYMD